LCYQCAAELMFIHMKLLANLSVASLLATCHGFAEVKLIREYLLKPPRDRRIIFAMTVTPEHDVLSLVANDDGTWRLSRVRRWLDKQPLEDSLTIPGLVQGGHEGWSQWHIWSSELFATPDGKFAVCIVSAYPNERLARNREDLVSVVSLAQFKIVMSVHTSALKQVSGNHRTYRLDRRGYLVVNASTSFPRHPGDDPFFGGASHKFAILTLPALDVTDGCEYVEWLRSGSVVRREKEDDCATLLQNSGTNSLDEFSKTLLQTAGVAQANDKGRPPECAFLTYASVTSRDGRFRWERCTGGHRGFFGNFVVSKAVENIFLVETGQKLGTIKVPSDHPLQSRFATLDGMDYLLVMEGGTRLTVYQIAS